MKEPIWLSADLVIAIHDEQLCLYGGPEGLRDSGALESALGRARNRFHYDKGDLAALAAAYAFGIANNHAFVDGNKRTAFLAIITFLGLNGIDFDVAEPEAVIIIRGVAAGEIDEGGLTRWIADNLPDG
ncbi:MAG TPA: type II toxin-antitoxin system death-on-curing family toxin [Rhizobiales bacterium]|nr:toxin Doc [bacterium BMS3Bbin10]HDO52173.1 type II toxin-antitoxin system death-on-curing family toxin [Hyphomicrobiales bacterium]